MRCETATELIRGPGVLPKGGKKQVVKRKLEKLAKRSDTNTVLVLPNSHRRLSDEGTKAPL